MLAAPTPIALGGVDGIIHLLRSLLAEASLLMAFDGYQTCWFAPDAPAYVLPSLGE
jgi:hypothetical protein